MALRSAADILLSIAILSSCTAPAGGTPKKNVETCEREGIRFRLLGLLSSGAALPSSWEDDAMMDPDADCRRDGLHDHVASTLFPIDSDAWSRMGHVLVRERGSCTEHGLRCLVTARRIEGQTGGERGLSKRQDAAVAAAALAHRKTHEHGTDGQATATGMIDGLGLLKHAATTNGSSDDTFFNAAAAFASRGRCVMRIYPLSNAAHASIHTEPG